MKLHPPVPPLLLALLAGCSLLADRPNPPSGPAIGIVGDTAEFEVYCPARWAYSAQLRVDESITPWSGRVTREGSMLLPVTWTEPGWNLVSCRYRTAAGIKSEWSSSVLVRVLPRPGYPDSLVREVRISSYAPATAPDFSRVYATVDGVVFCYAVPELGVIASATIGETWQVAADPTGSVVYALNSDTLYTMSPLDLTVLSRTAGRFAYTNQLAAVPAGLVVATFHHNLLRLVKPDSPPTEDSLVLPQTPGGMLATPTGRLFVWEVDVPRLLEIEPDLSGTKRSLPLPSPCSGLAYDPTSDVLWASCGAEDSTVFVAFSLASGQVARSFATPTSSLPAFGVTPGGRFLLHTDPDGGVARILDTHTGSAVDSLGWLDIKWAAYSRFGEYCLIQRPGRLAAYSVRPTP